MIQHICYHGTQQFRSAFTTERTTMNASITWRAFVPVPNLLNRHIDPRHRENVGLRLAMTRQALWIR